MTAFIFVLRIVLPSSFSCYLYCTSSTEGNITVCDENHIAALPQTGQSVRELRFILKRLKMMAGIGNTLTNYRATLRLEKS